ncbi:molybdopterin cofactor-binding domain-containing protein [Melioribacter sp. OK-6-Me]|uniref:xanthine dehydrogenase family protein molybdopterin-binding subunit n=1 Tax=unclassified Melioribacter TaxID=2627329 RepID=UPI003EDA3C95
MSKKQTRRQFIKVFSLSSSALCLASFVPMKDLFASGGEPKIFSPSVYLKIDSDGIVTIVVHRSEMGQGVRTALPMIVAEELEVDWRQIKIEQAEGHPKYGDQVTGGSTSVRKSWDPLRIAGATAREMLIAAAAIRWNVKPSDCKAENGFVINKLNNKKIGYGDLVEEASKLPVPQNVKLKDPKDYKIIGKRLHRTDSPDKISGKAIFGIDVVLPGLIYAAVKRSPVLGSKVKSFNADKTKSLKGIIDVKEVTNGVAVFAESTWQAFKGVENLSVEWSSSPYGDLDSEKISQKLKENLLTGGTTVKENGNPKPPDQINYKIVEAIYEVPYQAHAPMEPMNCTAKFENNRVEVWAPTQNPQDARRAVANALGLKEEDVTIYVTFMGGGFGRRTHSDFAAEAAELSKVIGKPVKVTWTREDDIKHDRYRPVSMHHLKGAVDNNKKIYSFSHHVIAPSIAQQNWGARLKPEQYDIMTGAIEADYKIPNYRISGSIVDIPIPIWYWRSVYHSQNPFAAECFIDELAHAAGRDPYEFRMELLPDDSRLKAVLKTAAEKAEWGKKLPPNKGMGIALSAAYDSFCAQVAEVSINNNKIKVEKIVCAVDVGIVINPDIVEQQVDSGIAFALNAALKGEITIRNGEVVESNFDDYPLLSFAEMPIVETYIMQNTYRVGGMGEVPIAPCAPAVGNAIFAATGVRLRKLPFRL